jgi:hypothetical protein
VLEEALASKASVFEFGCNITSFWSVESQRVLGHVVYAPPISVSEDWALIELDRTKSDWDAFIHLGSISIYVHRGRLL